MASRPTEVRRRLTPATSAAAEGRALVDEVLRTWDLADLTDDAALVTSELVANAVLHARGPVELRVARSGTGVRIEVSDLSPSPPMRRDTAPLEPGGLGLVLVERIARDWGTSRRSPGKVVWAEVDRSGTRHPGPR